MGGLRKLAASFVVSGPCGVAVRDRLKHLTPQDERVLRAVGAHQGTLASRDLKTRCSDGLEHSGDTWAARKRDLTGVSSSRIAGAITKATHDQWALARRCQAAHIQNLATGIKTLRHRLSLPVGEPGTKRAAGGYRSKNEWFRKSRRLAMLEARHAAAVAEWQAGRVRVVRGGKRLLNTRHHLTEARLTEGAWRERWEAERWFIAVDGESGKQFGNETIRVTPDGEVSIKLPVPLAHLANTRHGRYTLTATVAFAHRGQEWADRIGAVDPAYTSMWGGQHWQKPLTTPHRKISRHDAAGIAIGRRALGHPIRRRTAPPPHDQSDRAGHRTAQAEPGARGREGTRPPTTDRPPGGPSPSGKRTRGTSDPGG
ncbi:hypothetical protein ACWEAF_32195 [Streptomyces sp. NPDC005071]